MAAEHDDEVDALRVALYREGATADDRARYEEAVGEEGVPPPSSSVRRPRRRPLVAGAVVVIALVIAGGALLLVRPAPRPPYPQVASTPIALLGDPDEQQVARSDLRTLFDEHDPFLGLYLSRHSTALSSSLRTDSIAVDGHGTGPTTVRLQGITTPGQPTGLMTVLLACDRATSYSWVLTGPDGAGGRPTRTGASGEDCGGGVVTATFVPKPHHVPTRIRVTVPEGVRVLVEVDLSKY